MDVVNNEAMGRLEVRLPDGVIAFADYRRTNGRILFPHTVVPPAHEGQGIGSALVRAGLALAREEGLSVLPQCSFFLNYMKRHPETLDLLDASFADRL